VVLSLTGPVSGRDPPHCLAARSARGTAQGRLRHGGTMTAMSSPGSRRFPWPLPVFRSRLSDPPPHRRLSARHAASARCSLSTTAGPTPKRSASRPGSQSHRPHHPPTPQGSYTGQGGISAWAAQMTTSVTTERDRTIVRARARSRRSARTSARSRSWQGPPKWNIRCCRGPRRILRVVSPLSVRGMTWFRDRRSGIGKDHGEVMGAVAC
jgi:hypothetical protein